VIYLGADHRGFALKEEIKKYLEQQGYEFRDLGNVEYDPDDDYPDFAFPVANQVAEADGTHYGILLCGSGVGICVAANKVKGIRAGMAVTPEQIRAARQDDDINVLCIAADFIDRDSVYEVVETFVSSEFSEEERHARRLDKIKEHEEMVG